MKYIILIIGISVLATSIGFSQKKTLTDTSYIGWTEVNKGMISNDGKYASYNIDNKPIRGATKVIISTDGLWKKDLINFNDVRFSDNSKYAFTIKDDTLYQFRLGEKEMFTMPNCNNFELIIADKQEWLLYQQFGNVTRTIIRKVDGSALKQFLDVSRVIPNSAGGSVVLSTKVGVTETLKWLELNTGKLTTIYSGMPVKNVIFDRTGSHMAFRTVKKNLSSIWHYVVGQAGCEKVANDNSPELMQKHTIRTIEYWSFSKDSKCLFFTIVPKHEISKADPNAPIVWNYKDSYTRRRFERMKSGLLVGRNLCKVDIKNKVLSQVFKGKERPETVPGATGDIFICSEVNGDEGDGDIDTSFRTDYYVYQISTGKKFPLKMKGSYLSTFAISPDGKYAMFRNTSREPMQLFSTATQKLITVNSNGVNFTRFRPNTGMSSVVINFIGWTTTGKYLLLQDQFDIYAIEPDKNCEIHNLTKNVGSETRTIFYFANDYEGKLYPESDNLPILGLNVDTKETSLSEINIQKRTFNTLLKGQYWFGDPYYVVGGKINKAKYGTKYLLGLESAEKSQNYFFRGNDGKLVTLSNECPEKQYKWLTTELLTYKDSTGMKCNAILYKPENFDSTKRYPVILSYYQDVSQELAKYYSPEPVRANLNIPLMVSTGYLVVKPDIMLGKGTPGQSALRSVIAAADYLTNLPYVDNGKFGIIGHSVGGFETNYIVTHTSRFSAAVSGAGSSNQVQMSSEIGPVDGAMVMPYMKYLYGYRGSLFEYKQDFIDDSPILSVDNVMTPILIVHNDNDLAVPVTHSIELYVQLRSLKKPCWLVQYPGEGHDNVKLKNRLDYQNKVMEFYDYYLRSKPIPLWMDSPIKVE